MEIHHRYIQLALGAIHFTESAPAHQQAGHEEEGVHAERTILDEHRVGGLQPCVVLVAIDVRQIVEGHVTMSEDYPHHTEATQAVKAMDHIGAVHLFHCEDLWCIVQHREGNEQRTFWSCRTKIDED